VIQYYELPSVLTTVRKAVLDGVIARVLNESGLGTMEVIFTDPHYDNAHQVGATIGDQVAVSHSGSSKIYVEVQEERDEYSRINTVPGYDRQTPFFSIPTDDVAAQPIMTRYNVTITLRRNSPSPDELSRWVSRLNALLDMGRFSLMTEAEGYYIVPKACIELLAACYNAANTRKRDYASFKEYVRAGLSKDAFSISSQTGTLNDLAIRYSPTRIQVVYDPIDPYPVKEDTNWEAMLVVRFTYQCPEQVMVSYPHIINQTPLEDRYLPQTDPAWMSNEEGVARSVIQTLEDATIYNNFARILIKLPYSLCPIEQTHAIHYPDRDKELMVFASDIVFDEDNMTDALVLDTKSLNYEWNPYIKEYIDYCRRIDPSGQNCLFKFRLFQHGVPVENKRLFWTGDLLNLRGDVILEKKYFVTESVRSDWRGIDLYPLQLFPKALMWLIAWLFPSWDFPEEWWELERVPPSVVDKIKDALQPQNTGKLVSPVTVLNTTVMVVKHESQYVGLDTSGAYVLGAADVPVWVNLKNRKLVELLRKTILNGFLLEGV